MTWKTFVQNIKDLFSSIEPELLKPKAAYFTALGASGALYPIMSLWMRNQGLNTNQTGIIYSLRPFVSFIALPVAGIFMLSEFLRSPLGSLLDAGVMELLGERKGLYGKQRLWGSLGFGGVAFLMGAFVNSIQGSFNLYFYGHAVLLLVASLIFFLLPVNGVATPAPLWKSIGIVFSSFQTFIFFLLITMIGSATGIIGAFLFIFLDEIHASKLVLGLATAVSCVAELPFFFFSAQLLGYFGERFMLYLACGAGILRLLWYTFFTNPWVILPAEALHGLFYAAMWAASMSYVHKVAPPGMGATSQGLLGGLYSGLGNGLGALVGGLIYTKLGYVVLFRATAAWVALAWAMFFISNWFLGEPHHPPPPEPGTPAAVADDLALVFEDPETRNRGLRG